MLTGHSPAMRAYQLIEQSADHASVLIAGERNRREIVAQSIHRLSPGRRSRLSQSTVRPETLLESEILATRRAPSRAPPIAGRGCRARRPRHAAPRRDRGDDLATQVAPRAAGAFVPALRGRQIVGGCSVIAATNIDPFDAVQRVFEIYYRLNAFAPLPPLRDR